MPAVRRMGRRADDAPCAVSAKSPAVGALRSIPYSRTTRSAGITMCRQTSRTASPEISRRRIAKTGTPCATRSVRASSSLGMRALTASSTRDTE